MPIISGGGGGGGLPLTGGTLTGQLAISDTHGGTDNLLIAKPVGVGAAIHVTTPLAQAGGTLLQLSGDNGNASLASFSGGTSGYMFWTADNAAPVIACLAAPADGLLSASECALWFDDTNGVGNTKLMVKAKSADGTVKTAAIVLA